MDEDLLRLRRSLATAPSLPGDEALKLLDEVEVLRRRGRDLGTELDALVQQIQHLRSRI
jgi:hypothetical protein